MSSETYIVFVAACVLLVATPGPNVALIVATSLRHGARVGLITVAGVNGGIVLQLIVVAAGLSWVVDLFARHFDIIRYLGAGYLALLGLQQLLSHSSQTGPAPALSRERALARGFTVALANPKTLIFIAAFLPQFLSSGPAARAELLLLSATFAVIGGIGDACWALLASRLRYAVTGHAQRLADRISGTVLIGGAGFLLALRRD